MRRKNELINGGELLIGLIVRTLGATAVLHELFHVAAALAFGLEVTEFTWTAVRIPGATVAVLAAGYFGEIVLWTTVALVAIRYRRRGTGFAIGHLVYVALIWLVSSDRLGIPFPLRGFYDLLFIGFMVAAFRLVQYAVVYMRQEKSPPRPRRYLPH